MNSDKRKTRRTAYIYVVGGLFLWLGVSALTGTLCWIQATFGLPCPGCGSTRAVTELFRGNFAEAFRWHPLILVSMVLIPYVAIRSIFARRKPFTPVEKKIILGAVVLYVAVFFLRVVLIFPEPPVSIHDRAIFLRVIGFFAP